MSTPAAADAAAGDPARRAVAGRELVDVDCPLCGSAEREPRWRDEPFAVVTCRACDLTYVTPRLGERDLLERVYDPEYWRSPAARDRGYTDYRADEPLYLRTYRLRRRFLERHFAGPGRVLDVGCAAGYFLSVMREAGWDVHGLEPSEAIRETAEQRLGPGVVRAGTLPAAGFEPGSFDLITFWDVLEHLPDPVPALAAARELLVPGGRVLVETQNVASLAARLLGRRWQHYKHAEHLVHFHRGTLTRALVAAGLAPRAWTSRFGGKVVSPAFVAERAGKVHPALAALLSPLRRLHGGLYVNLFDELIVLAEPTGGAPAPGG